MLFNEKRQHNIDFFNINISFPSIGQDKPLIQK